jgi:hypothetical protein
MPFSPSPRVKAPVKIGHAHAPEALPRCDRRRARLSRRLEKFLDLASPAMVSSQTTMREELER